MANAKLITQVLGAVQDEQQFSTVISALADCKYYAYCFHDMDVNEDGSPKLKHLHFVAEDRHSLKKWAEHFGLPVNMIEICHGFRASNRYLIHLDDPEKYQYSRSIVVSNKPLRFESYLNDNQEMSPIDLYSDMRKVRKGVITTRDFIEKYKFWLHKQSFYCQFKIYTDLSKYE